MKYSIIIPVLNEAEVLEYNLQNLQWARQLGHEIIVVDGGSQDQSMMLAGPFADHVIASLPGRALQMNAGAKSATGDVFVFLHVDTLFPADGIDALDQNIAPLAASWGRFDVQLSGKHILFRGIERMMNWRSRITGIATGDQAIFISRELFEQLDGYSKIPLMEDIEICHRLKKIGKPVCLSKKVVTSSRRWEKSGIVKTVLLMWRLRLAYWFGADPVDLAHKYRQ